MISAAYFRLKIMHERRLLRQEEENDFIKGAIWALVLCERLLKEAVKESKERNILWPRWISKRHAAEFYLAIQAALSYFRDNRPKLGIRRLEKIIQKYQSEKVAA